MGTWLCLGLAIAQLGLAWLHRTKSPVMYFHLALANLWCMTATIISSGILK